MAAPTPAAVKSKDPTPVSHGTIYPGPKKLVMKSEMNFKDHVGDLIIISFNGYDSQGWLLGSNEGGIFVKQKGGHSNCNYIPWQRLDNIQFPDYVFES